MKMSNEKIRVAIADDQEIYRDGLRLVLSKCERFSVVAEAGNGQALLEMVAATHPDVVLTDVVMPVMDGIAATRQIIEQYPEVKVIALSMFGEEAMILDMLEAGARGYLVKNSEKEDIYSAIKTVYNGDAYYCNATSSQMARLIMRNKNKITEPAIQFSDKELQIIRGICEEMNNQEMARELYMSKRTIDGYRSRILEKLHVKGSIGVVKYAIKAGIYKL
jgi:two-component system, NarL family, response regulator NreC